jgi:DNA anti-recombination protein RmuC
MDWARIGKFVLSFSMKYWKEILIVSFLIAALGKTRLDYIRLQEAYETSQESLKNQLLTLKELHANELAQRDAALDEYKKEVARIEADYKEDIAELEEQTESSRREIVEEIVTRKQFSENKQELAEKVIDQFGFEYVP